MKKELLISLAILAAQPRRRRWACRAKSFNRAAGRWGGPKHDSDLAHPGRTIYVIDSIVPLEVGGTICTNPEGKPTS